MYKSRRYRSKELKRALLIIQQMQRRERRYNPDDNIIPGKAKPGDRISDLEGAGLWKRTRKELFEEGVDTGGFNQDSVREGKFEPGEKPSDFAGLWKKTRPGEV